MSDLGWVSPENRPANDLLVDCKPTYPVAGQKSWSVIARQRVQYRMLTLELETPTSAGPVEGLDRNPLFRIIVTANPSSVNQSCDLPPPRYMKIMVVQDPSQYMLVVTQWCSDTVTQIETRILQPNGLIVSLFVSLACLALYTPLCIQPSGAQHSARVGLRASSLLDPHMCVPKD